MYGFAPYSDNAYCDIRVIVPDPPYLWCGACWETHAVGLNELPSGARWDTQALTRTDLIQNVTWVTAAVALTELPIGARWITATVGGELIVGARWATHIPDSQELPSDQRYAVVGANAQELPVGAQWLVEGAPFNVLEATAAWVTQAPVLQVLDADGPWETVAPVTEFFVAEGRWETHVADIQELMLDGMWRFNYMVAQALSIVYSGQVRAALGVKYQLGLTKVRNALTVTSPLLSHVAGQLEVNHPIAEVDTVQQQLSMPYSLLDGSVVLTPASPVLTVQGRLITLQEVEISAEEGQFAWTCQATLPDPALLELFGQDEPFTVNMGGEVFSFIATETRLARGERPVNINATVAGISPSAVYAEPRAEKVIKTWDTAVLVSDVLEELFGADVVELRGVQDWAIPAGRLSINGQTPMEIASQIAQATGALLESDPDGSLYMRPAWPVSVPFLETAEPDHVYDDLRDVFTVEERTASARLSNRIRIMDAADAASGLLAAEVDGREEGYNQGRTSFQPGDQPAILIFKSSRVELDDVRPSAGNVVVLASGTMDVEEALNFADTAEATLRYPTAALTSYKWLGNDLGVPTLSSELTIQVPTVGVGRLLVEYETVFEARRISGVPAVLNGETEYEVLVLVEGSQT